MSFAVARSEDSPMMELNTTPLIDVMLVLLVMFIITIPVQTHAVKVELPAPVTIDGPSPSDVVNTLTVDRAGAIAWNGPTIDLATLRLYLDRTSAMAPEPELHFMPAATARFDTVDHVLAVVKRSRVTKFGFVGNENYWRYDR